MPDPQRHAENRGVIESILRHIPGFRGYLEKEYRRESDYLIRIYMADRIQAAKRGLDSFMHQLVERAELDAMSQLERVRSRLDKLESLMRAQVRGYSGFFDFVQVDESKLDEVYQHDVAMVDQIEALAADLESLSAKPDAPAAVAADLLQKIDAAESRFSKRSDILQGLSE